MELKLLIQPAWILIISHCLSFRIHHDHFLHHAPVFCCCCCCCCSSQDHLLISSQIFLTCRWHHLHISSPHSFVHLAHLVHFKCTFNVFPDHPSEISLPSVFLYPIKCFFFLHNIQYFFLLLTYLFTYSWGNNCLYNTVHSKGNNCWYSAGN